MSYVTLRLLLCDGRLNDARLLMHQLRASGQLPCSAAAEQAAGDTGSQLCGHHSLCRQLAASHVRNEAAYAAYIALLLRSMPSTARDAAHGQRVYLLGDSHCLSGARLRSAVLREMAATSLCPDPATSNGVYRRLAPGVRAGQAAPAAAGAGAGLQGVAPEPQGDLGRRVESGLAARCAAHPRQQHGERLAVQPTLCMDMYRSGSQRSLARAAQNMLLRKALTAPQRRSSSYWASWTAGNTWRTCHSRSCRPGLPSWSASCWMLRVGWLGSTALMCCCTRCRLCWSTPGRPCGHSTTCCSAGCATRSQSLVGAA